MKKWLIICLAIIMGVTSLLPLMQPQTAHAAEERTEESYMMYDIWGTWAEAELDDLINADIFKGYVDDEGDYYLDPARPMTRAQFAAIVVRALNLEPTGNGKGFSDVSATHALVTEIQIANDHGIIFGKEDGTFAPNERIKRDQLATMMVRAFKDTIDFTAGTAKPLADIANDYWAREDIEKASRAGIIRGDENNNFRPRETATRAHAGVMLQRALQKEDADLPTDEELKDVALKSELEGLPLVEANDIAGLKAFYERYFTGYQKASSLAMVDWFVEEGVTQKIAFTSEPTASVVAKATRFAKVKIKGEMKYSFNDGTTSLETTTDYEAIHYMKKTDDGWKIYYTEIPFEEDVEELVIKDTEK